MIKGFKKFCLCLLAAGAAGGILAGCNSPAKGVITVNIIMVYKSFAIHMVLLCLYIILIPELLFI